MKKIYLSLLVTMVLVSSASAIEQTAVVATRIVSGNPAIPNSQFTVLVEVSDNDTGEIPIACAFRVHYPLTSVSYVSVSDGDLGTAMASVEQYGVSDAYRDILTMSNFSNTNTTPACFTLTFQVNANPQTSYTIWAEDDPDNQALLDFSFLEINHGYDNSATTDLAVVLQNTPTPTATNTPPPSPDVTISTSILSGDPTIEGSQFVVQIAVTDNPTTMIPIAAAFRMHYATESLTFISASFADLGNVFEGPEEWDGTGAFRDVLTMSNFNNVNLTPTIMNVTFQVNVSPVRPYSITLEKDPKNDVVVAKTFDIMGGIFDNSATTDMNPQFTPTFTPTSTPPPYTLNIVSTVPNSSTVLMPGSSVSVLTTVTYNVTGSTGSVYLGSMLYGSSGLLANSTLQTLTGNSGTMTTTVSTTVPSDGVLVLKAALVDSSWNVFTEKTVNFSVATPTPTPNEWYEIGIVSTSPATSQLLQPGLLYDIGVTLNMTIVTPGTGANLHISLWTNSGLLKQNSLLHYSSSRTGITQSIASVIPNDGPVVLRARLLDSTWNVLAEASRTFNLLQPTSTSTPIMSATPMPSPTGVSAVKDWDVYE